MADAFIGEIRIFAGNFAPVDWAMCNGQLLPIAQNTALFSILGTTYGGNGTTTFALPNLQGRVPLHAGQGQGLSDRPRGQAIGTENHVLATSEMPFHAHTLGASTANGNNDAAALRVMARSPSAVPQYDTTANTTLSPSAVATSGDSQPHNNMQPYLAMNFIICLYGIFPPRS
jgi:microcystin-dependent protein